MQYLLRNSLFPSDPHVTITAEQYAEFGRARETLGAALAIEETYEILVTNYLEFERQILDATINFMVRQHASYSEFFDSRLGANVHLVNLLTAARLYVEQLKHNVRLCLQDKSDAKEIVDNLCKREYDRSKDYRVMDALRNHVQHRGAPVHLTRLGADWTSSPQKSLLEFSMDLVSQRSVLEQDDIVPRRILAEVSEEIDLKATTRGYVESISNIHHSVRKNIDDSVIAARQLIERAQEQYATSHPADIVRLAASRESGGKVVSSISLLLDWDDVRQELVRRNRRLRHLRRSHVTSRLKTNPA